jgi:cell wall-associated NlpC family hydrolase
MLRGIFFAVVVMLLAGCTSTQSSRTIRTGTGANPRMTPITPVRPAPSPAPPIVGESAWQSEAAKWIGTPYRLGGTTRAGMDCSALVGRMYQNVTRLNLPRETADIARIGVAIRQGQLLPGDILLFQTSNRAAINHAGVYLGTGRFVHASTSAGVIYSRLSEPYYAQHYRGARRIFR